MASHSKNDIEHFRQYHETGELISGENYPFLIQSCIVSPTVDSWFIVTKSNWLEAWWEPLNSDVIIVHVGNAMYH